MPDLNIIEKGLKAGYGLLSPAAMILGIIATVFLFFQRSWPWSYRLVPVVFLYGMLISPIGMRMCENQHLTTNQPLAVTLMVGLIYRIIERPKATNTEKTK